jgi:hypothetical protein
MISNKVDLASLLPPESKSSASPYTSHAREPGDLGGAGRSRAIRRHGREGGCRTPQQSFEESDARVVPTWKKSANTRVTPVESMEGRRAANGKPASRNALRTQGREGALTALERVGQRAKQRKGDRFTNLLSHLKGPLLTEAYNRLRKDAAPGVDGITWRTYGKDLDARVRDLHVLDPYRGFVLDTRTGRGAWPWTTTFRQTCPLSCGAAGAAPRRGGERRGGARSAGARACAEASRAALVDEGEEREA